MDWTSTKPEKPSVTSLRYSRPVQRVSGDSAHTPQLGYMEVAMTMTRVSGKSGTKERQFSTSDTGGTDEPNRI